MYGQILALEDLKSCNTDGNKVVPKGTVLTHYRNQLSWEYFKSPNGLTVILMGW